MLLSTGDDPPTATLTLGHGRIRSVGSELDLHGLVCQDKRGGGGCGEEAPGTEVPDSPESSCDAYDALRATVLSQHALFRHQLLELHRLVKVQAEQLRQPTGPAEAQLDMCALGKALRSGATTDAGSSPDGTRLQAPSAWPGQSGGSGGDGSGGGSGGAHTGADGAPGAALAKAPPCERTAEAVGGPPPPGCAPTARPDPFLLAAQGAVAAAAAGRASAAWRCASAAERVALLGRRWYTPVEYPLAAPGAHPLQAQAAPVATCEPSSGDPGSAAATTGDVADAFQKPPRLILRHDGTTVVAPDDQADARTVTAGCVAGVKRARGDGAHKGEGSSRAAPLCGLSSAGALAPLLHYPIAPPAAVARRCAGPQALQQGLHWHASADAVTRIPTAPRSRLSATFREPAPAPTPPREEARLAEVLSIARRGSLRARNAPVPGPGAGFACLAGLAPAKALPPSFAFELLPRMVPLSRADVGADLRAIASAAESLFGLMDEALPTATKRARLSGLL